MRTLNTTKDKLIALLIIVFIAMSGLMGIDIHLASIPYIMHYMHVDQTQIQQSITLYLLGMGVSLLLYGPLSDKYGRRPVVMFGLGFACVASLLSIFTDHITPFLLTRLMQGIEVGACAGMGRTMAVDVLRDKSLSAAYLPFFSAVLGLSPLLAPLLGGYLQHWFGWQANFVFLAGLFFILFIVYSVFCPETNLHINKKMGINRKLGRTYVSLLSHSSFLLATLACGLAMAASITYATLSPFIFQLHYHLSPVTYGWITTSVALGMVLGRFVNGLLSKRYDRLKTLSIGMGFLLLAGVWITFFKLIGFINIPIILVGVFFALFSQAFISVSAMQIALMPHHDKRGLAGSLFSGFQMAVTAGGAMLISALSNEGVILLGGAYLVFGVLGILLYKYLTKLSKQIELGRV